MANLSAGSERVAENLQHAFDSQPLEHTDVRGGEGVAGTIHGGGDHAAPSPAALGMEAEGWVALAMLILIGLLLWRGVHKAIGRALDGRIAAIRSQLDEASRLRAEAEALKAEYEKRAASAAADADEVRAGARREADAILAKAEEDAGRLIERRAAMAEGKIAAAERAAVDEVRRRTVEAASAAAARLIAERLDAGADRALVDRSIAGLGRTH